MLADLRRAAADLSVPLLPPVWDETTATLPQDGDAIRLTTRGHKLESELLALRGLLHEPAATSTGSECDTACLTGWVEHAERAGDLWLLEAHLRARRDLAGVAPHGLRCCVFLLNRSPYDLGAGSPSLIRSRVFPFDRRPEQNRVGLCSAPTALKAEWLSIDGGDAFADDPSVPDKFFAAAVIDGAVTERAVIMARASGRSLWHHGYHMHAYARDVVESDLRRFAESLGRWRDEPAPGHLRLRRVAEE